MSFTVHYVGQQNEVAHHAAPLADHCRLQMTAAEDVVSLARPGDVAIFFSEHFDRFRDACSRLKERGIATIYAIDGILEWRNAWENQPNEPACPWTMRPVIADKVACISRHQARIVAGWGNERKVEVVGIPRLDRLSLGRSDASSNSRQADTDRPWRLLVTTAKVPGFTPEQIELTTRSLRELRDWLATHAILAGRPVEVVWRLTQGLERELGVSNSLTSTCGAELAQLLPEVDAVITTPSTVMLEAMLLGLPTAILDYHGVPDYVPAAWSIRHAEDLVSVVTDLMHPSERRLFYQRQLLRDELEFETPATPRLLQLITGMHEISLVASQSSCRPDYPANMVSLERPGTMVLEHTRLYPDARDFRTTDRLELQAQLAHSRREISHLQRQLNQKAQELLQAHQIFEQIHRHPIAGPIVRLRQWLGRLFTRQQGKSIDNTAGSNRIPPVPRPSMPSSRINSSI